MSEAPRSRRWFLYGLGTATLLVLVSGVGLIAWHQLWKRGRQAQQRAAAEKVEALGGEATHSLSSLSLVARVMEAGDAPNIFLLNSRNLTDDDLALFQSAPTTRGIHLFGNQITDDGLVHLKHLTALEHLDLRRNNITDAGLVHLEGLHNLKDLNLLGTRVTPQGVGKLQKKLPNAKIVH